MWRCHIGIDTFNAETDDAWAFLKPYLDDVDRFVFTRADYRPDCIAAERVRIITPSLDPLSAKNRPMTEAAAESVLAFTGLIDAEIWPPGRPFTCGGTDPRRGWNDAPTSFSSARPHRRANRWWSRSPVGTG